MATKVKKNTSKPRATARTKAASRRAPGLTDQQRLDAIGLGLMAAAVFFAFVFYFGWQGESSATGSRRA